MRRIRPIILAWAVSLYASGACGGSSGSWTCIDPGCGRQASFARINGNARTRAEHCQAHRLPGECNVRVPHNACFRTGCTRQATYGSPEDSKPVSCTAHHRSWEEPKGRRMCEREGCQKIPVYGDKRDRIRRFCASHRLEGFVQLNRRLCVMEGCQAKATYGAVTGPRGKDRGFPTHCSAHRAEGLVNVVDKRCRHPDGCFKQPFYGEPSTTNAEFCKAHKPDHFVDVRSSKCAHPSCTTQVCYGLDNGSRRLCLKHSWRAQPVERRGGDGEDVHASWTSVASGWVGEIPCIVLPREMGKGHVVDCGDGGGAQSRGDGGDAADSVEAGGGVADRGEGGDAANSSTVGGSSLDLGGKAANRGLPSGGDSATPRS